MKVMRIIGILSLLTLPLASSCSWPTKYAHLQAYDEATPPGREVTLRAKLEYRGHLLFRLDIHRQKINFLVNDEYAGSALTGRDGTAQLKYTPEAAGVLNVRAAIDKSSRYTAPVARALLLCAEPDDRFIVTDIDQTIAYSTIISSLFLRAERCPVVRGSPEVMARLAGKYKIIYVTGRDDSTLEGTRAWLRVRGFPEGPVFIRDMNIFNLSRAKFKRALFGELMGRGINIVAAFGNRGHDVRAARTHAIPVILIRRSGEDGDGVFYARDWSEVEQTLATLAE